MIGARSRSQSLSQERHFDAIASEYDCSIPEHVMAHLTARRLRLALELAPLGGRVLDVGCGTGRFLAAMPATFDKSGVDISDSMLARARSLGLDVRQSGADELPFADASFDLVTSFAVLHHLIDPQVVDRALHEMCRVTRSGGAVLVWDHNPLNPYWPLLMRRVPQDQGDERLVPARAIRSALRRSGMREVRLRRMTFTPDFTPRRMLPAVARVETMLERVPGVRIIAAHNVVTGRVPPS